ncbi:hypothetical protein RJ640_030659 [Escallonia rubra]|uniref:Zinc finger family protein n=1 Tax=Escallonia rubra TaxID=112253 RepID=A0AA88R445_9ASTE|nr:hypothetical protein RJ640_030659 [Escallonia rubra]
MVLGWRRAFCTSIPRDRDPAAFKDKQEQIDPNPSPSPSPRFGGRFGFLSSLSTPKLQSQPVSSPSLRCRTTSATPNAPVQSVPESPKLQCKTRISPKLFQRSNPSSPRSPSTFSLIKSSLRLSKSRCGICLENVKAGQGMAIFTAECSHSFHFSCIAAHVKKQGNLTCPVCSSNWKEMPILTIHNPRQKPQAEEKKREIAVKNGRKPDLKVYNDDEPLMSPTSGARFNPIPESDENDDDDNEEFQGFFVEASTRSPIVGPPAVNSRDVEVRLLPEAAVVSAGRSSETYAVVLKVRAPSPPAKATCRAPIDLVAVLDISGRVSSETLQMVKRGMRLIISSLSSSDRLSIVAFSASSKRLLPLRRMTSAGRRSARRIVDALAALEGTSSASDALKKATKVLEDRREKNPAASIMLLSNGHNDRSSRQSFFVSSTRHPQMDVPVHRIGFSRGGPWEDAFGKCAGGLLSVVVQDLRLQLGFVAGSAPAEIAAVYSYAGRHNPLGSGSVRLGELYAEEERELLVELKVPSSAIGAHHVLSVRCSYRDPSTQEVNYGKEQALLLPRPHAVRSSSQGIQRLRNLFVATRAVAESRRLMERNDLSGAHHMLSSARALMLQSSSDSASEFIVGLEAELTELQRKRQSQSQQIRRVRAHDSTNREFAYVDEKGEPLTPTSAWRAAERLAKVAIMRKSLNRVSDLHGFEDARF